MTASKLQPALIAGVAIGLLSGIPIINIGNCCCCLWVVAGGALAAYLLQQRQASPIDLGDAALVGLMAGAIGAVVSTIISLPFAMLSGAMNQQAAIDALSNARDLPPEAREYVERIRGFLSGGGGAALGVIGFFFSLVIDAIFATLGGLIGGLVFKKKRDASLPPPPPPFMA
jgi:hypothetical protein